MPQPNGPELAPFDAELLERGRRDHYRDSALYDFEYRRRKQDIRFYRKLAFLCCGGGEGGSILDLGCGTGRVALPLARAGHRVCGIDLSQAMLHRAKQKAESLSKSDRRRLVLLCGDLGYLPFGRRFSLAISPFNTLQHVYDVDELCSVFSEIRSVVHDGGYFAFDVMQPELPWLLAADGDEFVRRRLTHPHTHQPLRFSARRYFDRTSRIAIVRMRYTAAPSDGAASEVIVAHRQYTWSELALVLKATGWTACGVFGGFSGEPVSSKSDSLVVVAVAGASKQSPFPS
jgi:SAM-dependent methyltransferase